VLLVNNYLRNTYHYNYEGYNIRD